MAPGIDMLHHFGPLMRSKSTSTHGLLDGNTSNRDSFDYSRFRRHFATLFDRIVRLASSSTDEQAAKQATATEQAVEQLQPAHQVNEIGSMQRMLGDKKSTLPRAGNPNLSSSLEAVEDEEEYDEDDLRDMGYRKDYGPAAAGADGNEGAQKKGKRSEWVNEDFELPTTEELFSDLGIWW